jgi:hypothetical protein
LHPQADEEAEGSESFHQPWLTDEAAAILGLSHG